MMNFDNFIFLDAGIFIGVLLRGDSRYLNSSSVLYTTCQ